MNVHEPLSSEGAVDAHVHLAGPSALADPARAGISAVRDAGTKDGAGLACRREAGLIVRSAGRAICKRGGYGARFGTAVEDLDEALREVRRLKAGGADIIKVMASGMVSLDEPDAVTPGGFSGDELQAIVEEASGLGLAVMAHANGASAIIRAARAGVRSIEHGFFMTADALALLKERGIFWVPTAGALQRAADSRGPDEARRRIAEQAIDRHLEMLGTAFSLGVPLAVGTDCVLPDRRYGGFFRDELAYFRKAGIPSGAVDRIARQGGRELLGLD